MCSFKWLKMSTGSGSSGQNEEQTIALSSLISNPLKSWCFGDVSLQYGMIEDKCKVIISKFERYVDGCIQEEQQMLDKYNSDKLIIFVNKMDLETKLVLSTNLQDVIYGNTIDINGLDKLKERIITKLNLDNIVNKDMSYLCNLREIDLINKAHEALISAQSNLDNGYSVDMIEIDLKSAWEYLGQIIGDSYDNELVDKIFSNFCLGK